MPLNLRLINRRALQGHSPLSAKTVTPAKKIAFQGQLGAYSHLSCQQVFPDHEPIAFETFLEALSAVEAGDAELAMIPLENSTAGRVEEIYRQVPKNQLQIVGEHFQPVDHCLMALPHAQPTWVSSHPQALAQCHDSIQAAGLQPIAEFDTAGAAKLLAEANDLSGSVIASSLAAQLYGLEILKTHFEDVSGNTTRFMMFSRAVAPPKWESHQSYITSILFKVRNIPAALYKALGGFATNGLNLIKIESYMDGGTLISSRFHVDVAAHRDDPAMQRAMDELAYFSTDIRWLGTYPAHEFRSQHEFI